MRNGDCGVRNFKHLKRYSLRLAVCAIIRALFSLISTVHSAETMATIYTTPYSYLKGVSGTLLKSPRRARWLFCI